jgi:hypothetical protein
MNPNDPQSKRKVLILVSVVDMVLSGIVLLIYFGFLPVDMSSWDIPRWVIGLIGGIWFVGALAVLVYQLTKTDMSE